MNTLAYYAPNPIGWIGAPPIAARAKYSLSAKERKMIARYSLPKMDRLWQEEFK